MDYYLDSVKLSRMPKEEVQVLLTRFIQKTQPDKLIFNPKVIEYSDTKITFGLTKHYGQMSLSVNVLMKNLKSSLNPFDEGIVYFSYNSDFLKMKIGKIEYLDIDILKVSFLTIVVRVDSITRLIPGGFKQFAKNKKVYGATNGRLIIMIEMRDTPVAIDQLYYEVLQPNGFEVRKDFVWGYSGLYETKDYGKPIEWCVVPWLDSVITPFGCYVKFLNPDK